tara:strand:+ start:184 stop:690 length:507 start_codon:yes stop_codon:yes gene_type:complete
MLYLIGFMGVGKTTIGKLFALQKNLKFIDIDKEIELRYQQSILDIYKNKGEEYFRKLETEVLVSISNSQVVACGGGLPIYNNNMSFIKNSGKSIYLKATNKKLFERLVDNFKKRPLIKNMTKKHLNKFIKEELTKREKIYSMADYTIDISDLSKKDILRKINSLIISF